MTNLRKLLESIETLHECSASKLEKLGGNHYDSADVAAGVSTKYNLLTSTFQRKPIAPFQQVGKRTGILLGKEGHSG